MPIVSGYASIKLSPTFWAFGREIEAQMPSLLLKFTRRTAVEFCTSARRTQSIYVKAVIEVTKNSKMNQAQTTAIPKLYIGIDIHKKQWSIHLRTTFVITVVFRRHRIRRNFFSMCNFTLRIMKEL